MKRSQQALRHLISFSNLAHNNQYISHIPDRSMASYYNYAFNTLAVLAIAFSFCIQGTLGSIACEDLNKESCAYAISSSGKRCVLEQRVRRSGEEAFTCGTSEIEADKLKDWIESDECIRACGLERNVLGISSDSLLEPHFARKLCSTQCYNNCPNIIDLYFNLAAGEGLFLPKFCASRGKRTRRGMAEIRSSGHVAAGPVSGKFMVADGPEAAEFMYEEAEAPEAENMFMEEEALAPAF